MINEQLSGERGKRKRSVLAFEWCLKRGVVVRMLFPNDMRGFESESGSKILVVAMCRSGIRTLVGPRRRRGGHRYEIFLIESKSCPFIRSLTWFYDGTGETTLGGERLAVVSYTKMLNIHLPFNSRLQISQILITYFTIN